jgi:gliding-associated putative ABC transporter substrate-binding component GldG
MKQKVFITTALIIAILLVVNLLSNEFHLRFDLTQEQQYTLSDATLNILKNLEEPVTVKAYFSKNLPPQIAKTRQDFQELLIEYSNRADGNIQYEFIDPNKNETLENEAAQNGIQPVMINVREKDQVKQQKAFLGAVISLGDKRDVIPVVQPGTSMEYTLSTSIKKISIDVKPTIGFLQGHGEPSLNEMPQLKEQLDILYNAKEVTLSDSIDIPQEIKTLVIVRPTDSIPFSHFSKLEAFLDRGGNMAIAINRVAGNLQNAFGSPISTGLETWLANKGVMVQDNFVVDAKCGSVTMQQQQGFFTMQTQIPFPYIPLIGKFADHPLSKGLENILFEFVSSIQYKGDSTKKFIPLAFTSDQSNEIKAPVYFNVQQQWTKADLPMKGIIVAAALEGKLSNNGKTKMVVIGDGDFVVNGAGQQPRRLQPDNVNMLSNSIDWLSDDTGLISLRTKGVTSRPIDELEDSTKMILKYTNFLLPILLVVGYGVLRSQQNRIKRFKRMSENYEEA